MKSVKVIFENPIYNYITSVNPKTTDEENRKYFVNAIFDVGVFPKENPQKCIDIEFLNTNTTEFKDKIYLPFKSRSMREEITVLCDTKYKMPMTYNGEKQAEKMAEKYNGKAIRIPMQMNRYYIQQNTQTS